MKARLPSAWIVPVLWVTFALITIATFWFAARAQDGAADESGTTVVMIAPTMVVGGIIAAKRPGNRLGWLLCTIAISLALASVTAGYTVASLQGLDLPGEIWIAWMSTWLGIYPLFAVFTLAFLLFPTGRPPSPRWWPVEVVVLGSMALATCASAFMSENLAGDSVVTDYGAISIENPAGIDALSTWAGPASTVAYIAWGCAAVASASSVIVRFHRARGTERQQVKWLALVAIIAGSSMFFGLNMFPSWISDVGWLVAPIALTVGTPLAIGIAVLRHGLYDIDRLINRVAVYGILSLGLLVLYAGSVVMLQSLLSTITQGSDLAVAASTLVVAALFRPARSRLQEAVDRRFNRARYDAARTISAFSIRLREETDLDTLQVELREIVHTTMQPASVSIWIRPQ